MHHLVELFLCVLDRAHIGVSFNIFLSGTLLEESLNVVEDICLICVTRFWLNVESLCIVTDAALQDIVQLPADSVMLARRVATTLGSLHWLQKGPSLLRSLIIVGLLEDMRGVHARLVALRVSIIRLALFSIRYFIFFNLFNVLRRFWFCHFDIGRLEHTFSDFSHNWFGRVQILQHIFLRFLARVLLSVPMATRTVLTLLTSLLAHLYLFLLLLSVRLLNGVIVLLAWWLIDFLGSKALV